jgi:predicted phosphodiesterase
MIRHLVVGDIHGRFSQLEAALVEANYDPEHDYLIALGDLINRPGKQSRQVVDFFCDLVAKNKATILTGNHEYAIKALVTDAPGAPGELMNTYGFMHTLVSYGIQPRRVAVAGNKLMLDDKVMNGYEFLCATIGERHLRLIWESQPFMILKNVCEGIDLLLCHAGLLRGKTLQEMVDSKDCWPWTCGDANWAETPDDRSEELGLPGNMIACFGHFHYPMAPFLRTQRIGIGLELDVAVFSTNDKMIYTSDGDVYHIAAGWVCPRWWLKENKDEKMLSFKG